VQQLSAASQSLPRSIRRFGLPGTSCATASGRWECTDSVDVGGAGGTERVAGLQCLTFFPFSFPLWW